MAKRKGGKKPEWQLKIARERIEILFDEALRMAPQDKALANRYVQLARKIGMRYNVKIPAQHRTLICRHCKKYTLPGVTARQKTDKGMLMRICNWCGKANRFPLKNRTEKGPKS